MIDSPTGLTLAPRSLPPTGTPAEPPPAPTTADRNESALIPRPDFDSDK